jgi:predicted AAA+ superfamily ATPase
VSPWLSAPTTSTMHPTLRACLLNLHICNTIANMQGDKTPVTYIPRSLEPILQRAFREFPAVVLIGPRQSGKTTILKQMFSGRVPIISLEPPDIRAAAGADPRRFLSFYPPPVIFDEIQYASNLLPYIKERIDGDRARYGQYILTGSQNLLLMQQVTETLAGRTAVLNLLPLSSAEIAGDAERPFPWEIDAIQPGGKTSVDIWKTILRGFYPEIASHPDRDPRLWQAAYMQTYLERDLRNQRNIGDLSLFQVFLRALAARTAQKLSLSELARDTGISVNTAKNWLSLLQASFQVFLLRPYFANIGKRLVKSPKAYFADTGLVCYLVGLRDTEHAAAGPMGGALFENLVVSEIYKRFSHRGEEPAMYFWRTAAGQEVDLVLELQGKLIPVEIKASATPRPNMAEGIQKFRGYFGSRCAQGFVIHSGDITIPFSDNSLAIPFARL